MRVFLAIALVGCGSSDPAPEPMAAPVVVAAAAPTVDLAKLPASDRAAIASPPREQWACGFTVDENQGVVEHGTAIFRYGKRKACKLPVSLIAQGVWGCPESYERTDRSDGMVRTHVFTYDDHDHLTGYQVQVSEGFVWEGDRLAVTTREQWGATDRATYRDRGGELVAVDTEGRLQETYAFDRGHVVRDEEYVYGRSAGTSTIAWNGDKPEHVLVTVTGPIRGSVSRQFTYDCPAAKPTKPR